MGFENKAVIVTGAAAGIGEAISVKFARLLAHVVLVDKNEGNLKRVLDLCEKESKSGDHHLSVLADLSREEDVYSVVPKTVQRFGRIDVLINGAGIIVNENILDENLSATFDLFIAINLKAPILLTSKAMPYLIESKGNIINMNSVRSTLPAKKGFIYCSTKAALEMFTKCMAVDLAENGVRVNSVHPGYVKTSIYHSAYPDLDLEGVYGDLEKMLPFGIIQPEEVATLVVYLASDDARSVTGSQYYIDGGLVHLAKRAVEQKLGMHVESHNQ